MRPVQVVAHPNTESPATQMTDAFEARPQSGSGRPNLSIIIPVLNEVCAIVQTLRVLQTMRERNVEIIVVDGGSRDGTPDICRPWVDRVVSSSPGRALQMNAGARYTNARRLVFLHADTIMPIAADSMIARALGETSNESEATPRWGRFDVIILGRHPMLKVIALMMNKRSRWTGICTGDQAIFMNRFAYDAVGGFPEQPLMEDIEISKRLKALTRPICISHKVQTSGRRWETRGIWRTIWLMWTLRWLYWRGESALKLARRYR